MDIGWLLVGAAGVAGGLALVLVGVGVATAPALLPVGVALAAVAYLAWAVGSARVVATVYEEVGDPGRDAAADERTGRPEDRTDPDGNWRSAAADGGRTASGDAAPGERTGPGHERAGSAGRGRSDASPDDARTGLGPDGERIWDARERDRVGGWDDWEADWEWADRQWRSFQREYGDADWTDEDGDAGPADGRRSESGTRTGARQRTRAGGTRSRGRERRDSWAGHQREQGRDERAARARDVLGVPADADAAAVREAYRARVKEVHPDRGGDPEAFKRVQWAYEYLSDS